MGREVDTIAHREADTRAVLNAQAGPWSCDSCAIKGVRARRAQATKHQENASISVFLLKSLENHSLFLILKMHILRTVSFVFILSLKKLNLRSKRGYH